MDRINAYKLAELTAGARLHTNRRFHWQWKYYAGLDNRMDHWAVQVDTPGKQGDTCIVMQYSPGAIGPVIHDHFQLRAVAQFVDGRYLCKTVDFNIITTVMAGITGHPTPYDVGRLAGVICQHVDKVWHPDYWPRCSGVSTRGVRIVQKHLVLPQEDGLVNRGKCNLCWAAYRLVQREIKETLPGYPLDMSSVLMPMDIDKAHKAAYKYPLKNLNPYRTEWFKEHYK